MFGCLIFSAVLYSAFCLQTLEYNYLRTQRHQQFMKGALKCFCEVVANCNEAQVNQESTGKPGSRPRRPLTPPKNPSKLALGYDLLTVCWV